MLVDKPLDLIQIQDPKPGHNYRMIKKKIRILLPIMTILQWTVLNSVKLIIVNKYVLEGVKHLQRRTSGFYLTKVPMVKDPSYQTTKPI